METMTVYDENKVKEMIKEAQGDPSKMKKLEFF